MSDFDTTRGILDALAERHARERNGNSRAWIFVEEVRISTGFGYYGAHNQPPQGLLGAAEQRIDAFALHTWPSKKFQRVAYEVKASMTDLRRELGKPWKCQAALTLSNEFYLVAPADILAGGIVDEFPATWGVMAYRTSGLRTVRKAPWREADLPPYSFMLSIARNLQQTLEAVEA